MLVCGNCLYTDESMSFEVENTAMSLMGVADIFRCKLWGGGTKPDRYKEGMGAKGLWLMKDIQEHIPVATEVHTPEQVELCNDFDCLWIGARCSQNYSLLASLDSYDGKILIKRGFGMTIGEVIGLWDIMIERHGIDPKKLWIVERGINTFCRTEDIRWNPDIMGAVVLRSKRPDIQYMIDCSHSSGKKEYAEMVYRAFKAIGVKDFMFECWDNPNNAVTDKAQALSVKELIRILS